MVDIFIPHLYASALLNRAALDAVGIGADTPNPLQAGVCTGWHSE
jgi:hypothetical protein